MTWDVIQSASGELDMLPHGSIIPDGWQVVAETANPEYLIYMATLNEDGGV